MKFIQTDSTLSDVSGAMLFKKRIESRVIDQTFPACVSLFRALVKPFFFSFSFPRHPDRYYGYGFLYDNSSCNSGTGDDNETTSAAQDDGKSGEEDGAEGKDFDLSGKKFSHLMSSVYQDLAYKIDGQSKKNRSLPSFFNICLRSMREGEIGAFLINPEHLAEQLSLLGNGTSFIHAVFVFELRRLEKAKKDGRAAAMEQLSNNSDRLRYAEKKRLEGNEAFLKGKFKKAFFSYLEVCIHAGSE